MKIALYTEVFLPKIDGVVTRITKTLEQLERLGHEAIVITPKTPLSTYAGHSIIDTPALPFAPWYPEIKIAMPTRATSACIKEFNPDIVHSVNPIWLTAYGVFSARKNNKPLLASLHTDVPKYIEALGLGTLKKPSEKWLRRLHNIADLNLCTSHPMMERGNTLGINNIHLWPKAVDTRIYNPHRANYNLRTRLTRGHPHAPLITYIGRISKEKNLDQLINIPHKLPEARLAIIGSGPYKKSLENKLQGTNTVFTGYLTDDELAAAYATSDIFVFPSHTETLGLAALESFASGIPVVGARSGGLTDVITDGRTGFLVEPHNTTELINRLHMLIKYPELRKKMGAAARHEALQHSWEAATKTLVSYYRMAIDRHRR